jgi:hypothetical protein
MKSGFTPGGSVRRIDCALTVICATPRIIFSIPMERATAESTRTHT